MDSKFSSKKILKLQRRGHPPSFLLQPEGPAQNLEAGSDNWEYYGGVILPKKGGDGRKMPRMNFGCSPPPGWWPVASGWGGPIMGAK